MYSFSHLLEYLIVVQMILNKISWIYCHHAQENDKSELWKPRETNVDINLKEPNSSCGTIKSFDIQELGQQIDKEITLHEENNNLINNYYSDFNHMGKRNTNGNHKISRPIRKQLIKHKKSNRVKIVRTHPVKWKNKEQHNKINPDKVKKYEYQGTSLYENNKNPFKDNKSKYNAEYSVDFGHKTSKPTKTSDKNTKKKLAVVSIEKEAKIYESTSTNSTDDSFKDEDGNHNGASVNEGSLELYETKNIKENGVEKNPQLFQRDSGNSQKNNEYIEKEDSHKQNKKNTNEQSDVTESAERRDQAIKPHFFNIPNTKSVARHLSEKTSLSLKSGRNFKHKLKTDVISLPSENSIQEKTARTLNAKGSNNGNDGFDESKERDLGGKGVQLKFNDLMRGKGDVSNSNVLLNEIPREYGNDKSHKSNGKSYLEKSGKETINRSLVEHANHKISLSHGQNCNGKHNLPNHNSCQSNSINGLKGTIHGKRSNKKVPLKRQYTPKSDSEKEYYDYGKCEPHLYDFSSNTQENKNTKGHVKHSSKAITNKRNQRDIRKRLRKHNNYENHKIKGSNVYGYLQRSNENEDLNASEDQEGQSSFIAKDYDNSEYQNRKVDPNSNNNDKYTYKESFDEDTGATHDEENSNNKYNIKKTLSRQSHEPKQQGKEKCVAYKAEKVTKKPISSTVSRPITEMCTTKATICASKRTTVKTKTSPQTCNKSQTTKNSESENRKNNSVNEALDVFEKYLCGQLADEFVDVVMDKIKRSRKIYKELGFRNDTEETCDRCIETKPNKMPDKETIKMSMGKCLKNNRNKLSCYTCYSVPRPMEKFLNLLVLFEKEHENSVYNKIRDDSSFIFTGDYPEQFSQNNDNVENKYTGGRDSFSKDTFDKQDLIDESFEEKHDDKVANGNSLENEYMTSDTDKKPIEYSTESEPKQNENIDKVSDTKIVVKSKLKTKDLNSKNKDNNSIIFDKRVEENSFNDDFDMNVAPRSKYSSINEPETEQSEDSFDRASIKQRRKAFKSDTILGSKNTYITPKDPIETEAKSNMKAHQLDEQNFDIIEYSPSKYKNKNENQRLLPKERDGISMYENARQRHKTPYNYKGRWLNNQINKVSPINYPLNEKFGHNRNHFGYPPEDYNDGGERLHAQKNNGHYVANDFMSTGWDEYQLIPKQSDHKASSEYNVPNSVSRKRYYKNDYEEGLNMVKRESEPSYEDKPLFFEIPNIEYDLYR